LKNATEPVDLNYSGLYPSTMVIHNNFYIGAGRTLEERAKNNGRAKL